MGMNTIRKIILSYLCCASVGSSLFASVLGELPPNWRELAWEQREAERREQLREAQKQIDEYGLRVLGEYRLLEQEYLQELEEELGDGQEEEKQRRLQEKKEEMWMEAEGNWLDRGLPEESVEAAQHQRQLTDEKKTIDAALQVQDQRKKWGFDATKYEGEQAQREKVQHDEICKKEQLNAIDLAKLRAMRGMSKARILANQSRQTLETQRDELSRQLDRLNRELEQILGG
jgi:hypothetical protein